MQNISSLEEQTTCCIVGSGPAGAMLALLLARQGVPVMLLEEHMDFDRDFRGDTIHPSVMEILDQIGLADALLQLDHTSIETIPVQTASGIISLADFRRLKTRFNYITMLPQVRFLEFITGEAKRYPNFTLALGARVEKLVEEDGYVHGVQYRGQDGWHNVRAVLTVGADGRFSRMRKLAGFEPVKTSPPMDVLWFRLPRLAAEPQESKGRLTSGHVLVQLNRGDTWQIGYIIPKGGYQEIRAGGIERLHQDIAQTMPDLADRVETLQSWKQVSVLSVEFEPPAPLVSSWPAVDRRCRPRHDAGRWRGHQLRHPGCCCGGECAGRRPESWQGAHERSCQGAAQARLAHAPHPGIPGHHSKAGLAARPHQRPTPDHFALLTPPAAPAFDTNHTREVYWIWPVACQSTGISHKAQLYQRFYVLETGSETLSPAE